MPSKASESLQYRLSQCVVCKKKVGEREGGFAMNPRTDRFELRCDSCYASYLPS